MNELTIILIIAASMVGVGLIAIIAWFFYTGYLARLERRLAVRKGAYRELVAGLAKRDRDLLEPELRRQGTLHDFEALEAVLEEQARGVTERPAWLLDAYDRLGLVDKYVERLRNAKQWRERAFAAELLGRVGNAKAVEPLLETIQATRAEDADVREIALRAIARIADPRAVLPLIAALKTSEPWLAPRIADILVRHGDQVVEPMMLFLNEPVRHPARAWAANILGEMKAARAFPTLVRALSDPDDEVRAKSASALGRIGDRRAVTYLLDYLLSDPAPFVRARIAGALGQFNDTEVIDRLVRALGDPAWWVRMRSVEALEQIGGIAESPLMLALDDPDPEIRIRAAVALERLGVPARLIGQIEEGTNEEEALATLVKFGVAGARELLAENLLHRSPKVRRAVMEAIRKAGRQDLFPELIELARHDSSAPLRATALETLHSLGTRDAVPIAVESLGDPAEEVRAAAMQLVGDLGSGELGETIRPRTSDAEPLVRAAAARALGRIRALNVEAEFARLLKDPEAVVRAAAADGVADGHWTGETPMLTELLSDSAPEVRAAAAHALGQIGNADAIPALVRCFRDAPADLRNVITAAVARLDLDAMPALISILLETNDVPTRLTVVRTVGQLRSPESVRLLEMLWRDSDATIRAAAADALGRIGDARASGVLGEGVADSDERVRASAVEALRRLHRHEYNDRITELLLHDPSALVRERAALAVGHFRLPGGEVALLRVCTGDQPLAVRAAAVLALGAFDQESVVARVLEMADEAPLRELLRERLKSDSEFRLLGLKLRSARHIELRALSVATREQMEATLADGMRGALTPDERIRLVAGLRAFQGERSRTALLQVVRGDPSPEVRAAALTAVGGMLDADELLLTARRALDDPHASVRAAAVTLFSRVAPDKALPALVRMIRADDDEPTLKAVATQAEAAFEVFAEVTLGLAADAKEGVIVARTARFIHHPDLPRLLPALAKSGNPSVRQAVAELWTHRPELADEVSLEEMSIDPGAEVRRAAAQAWIAVRRFDRAESMLADPDPSVRLEIALGFLGAPSAAALSVLALDPDENVRGAAFVVHLLRGEVTERPSLPAMPREAAARAVLRSASVADLRRAARGDANPDHRLAAALALAILDDDVAHVIARSDPLWTLRDRVGQMLASWRDSRGERAG
ncbi:MAG: HEAT repeat domain-containing protein [Gemmatimonadota bacterium]